MAGLSSATVPFQVTVAPSLPAGAITIVNTTTSSVGTCSSCTVTNPTVAHLDAVKSLASVDGALAGVTTQVGPNDVLV